MTAVEAIKLVDVLALKAAYSQVVRGGDFLFVSGQGPTNSTGEFVFGTIQEETRLTLESIIRILERCGASEKNIVKCSVFLARAEDFAAMSTEYGKYFPDAPPARTTVALRMVKPEMKIEIDCIAYFPQPK